jgi:hypothetical protein
MSETRDYYVYGLWAPGAFEPDLIRYVGMGHGKRAFCPPCHRSKRVKAWIAEMGEEPLFDIIAADLTRDEAFYREREEIAKYGREGIDEGGRLLNVSTGGAGNPGWKSDDETRAKRGAKLSARNKATWAAMTPEERVEKMAARTAAAATVNRGRVVSDSTRGKMADAQRNQSQETRAKRAATFKARQAARSPEERSAQASRAAKALWAKRAAMEIAA